MKTEIIEQNHIPDFVKKHKGETFLSVTLCFEKIENLIEIAKKIKIEHHQFFDNFYYSTANDSNEDIWVKFSICPF